MRRLLRAHVAQGARSASVGAIQLASIRTMSDEDAREAVGDAIRNLVEAIVTTIEAIGLDDDEIERRHLYRDLVEYHDEPNSNRLRLLGGASNQEGVS